MPLFSIRIEIPAIDALVNYLIGADQAKIDALTLQVVQATGNLKQATDRLQAAVNQGV